MAATMAKAFMIEIKNSDLNSETLRIEDLGGLGLSGVVTLNEMNDVYYGIRSVDYKVNHGGDAEPMTWTLTPDDKVRGGGFFTGWKEFRELNRFQIGNQLLLVRHLPGESTLSVAALSPDSVDTFFNEPALLIQAVQKLQQDKRGIKKNEDYKTLTRQLRDADMETEDLEMFALDSINVVNQEEMDSTVPVDFQVMHVGNADAVTWTFSILDRNAEEPEGCFTGWGDFRRQNAKDIVPGRWLVFIRDPVPEAGRLLAVVVARDSPHLQVILTNPSAQMDYIYGEQIRRGIEELDAKAEAARRGIYPRTRQAAGRGGNSGNEQGNKIGKANKFILKIPKHDDVVQPVKSPTPVSGKKIILKIPKKDDAVLPVKSPSVVSGNKIRLKIPKQDHAVQRENQSSPVSDRAKRAMKRRRKIDGDSSN